MSTLPLLTVILTANRIKYFKYPLIYRRFCAIMNYITIVEFDKFVDF